MSDDEKMKKMNSELKKKSIFSIGERVTTVGANVPLIQVAAAIAEQIRKQIQLYVENEEMWEEMVEKIDTAQKQLNDYKPNEEEYNQAYNNYIEVLQLIERYIKGIKNKKESNKNFWNDIMSFVKASHISEVHKELLSKLNKAIKAFHFEIGIKTNNTVNVIDSKINLLFLSKGFDPNPKDVDLTKLCHDDIEDPRGNDKEIRGRKGRVQKKYYNGEAVAFIYVGQRSHDKDPKNNEDEKEKNHKAAVYHLYLSACDSILRFKGTLTLNGDFYIVTEWAEHGYLELYLKKNVDFPWVKRIKISKQIASAIQFCHNNQILHHNIRSTNILLDKDLNAKLTGFESARYTYENTRGMASELDGYRYFPPERFDRASKHPWCKSCDIYSFSVVLWEIASRKKPFEDIPTKKLGENLPKRLHDGNGPGEIENDTPSEFKDIIDKCSTFKQDNRPDIKQVSKELNTLYLNYHSEKDMHHPSSSIPSSNSEEYLSDWKQIKTILHQKEYKKAYPHVIRMADKEQNVESLNMAGKYFFEKQFGEIVEHDEKEAIKYFSKAAEKGDVESMYYCARLSLTGEHYDQELGIRHLRNAAEKQYKKALCWLAEILYNGGRHGQQKDLEGSLEFYRLYRDRLNDDDDDERKEKSKIDQRITEIANLLRI